MRFSIDPTDRAYDEKLAHKVAKVTFDGQVVPAAITADEEEGYVKSFQVDLDGSPVVDTATQTFRSKEWRGGKVVVEMRREDQAWNTDRKGESKVAVGVHPNGTVEVLVYSAVRPGACRRVLIPQHMQPDRGPKLTQMVGIYAGASAEHYCETFRDTLDPEDVARVAMEQCRRALADETQLARQ